MTVADQPPSVEVVVVSAASLPPSPADAAFSIVRLDGADLAAAPRLDESLAQIPGFSLFRRTSSLGANPTSQGVSLRGIAGSGASRALVTLDGVPQNDSFGGWVIWTRLPDQDIASATVVRGAGAGPFGAGALTGVVALAEVEPAPGAWSVNAAFGSLGLERGGVTAAARLGPGALLLSAAGEHSDGWIPVQAGRGAADDRLGLADGAVSLRYLIDDGPVAQSWRAEVFEEDRNAGLVGANSRARGASFSASFARAPSLAAAGWRAQAWLQTSDLANSSVAVAANRQTATLSNNQYATPSVGYGADAAVRNLWSAATLEVGADLRGAVGQDEEAFSAVNGVLTKRRIAGGQTFTGGLYAEATHDNGPLLLTASARVDDWQTFESHRYESIIATGAPTLSQREPARGGVLTSERLGARLDVGAGQWLRLAAYSGFRAPTLNELYRPFRVGNNVTEANPGLIPEQLYGVEGGAGGAAGRARWSVTVFYNQLDNPVTNVTVRAGPFNDPVAGFIPAGGVLLQRQNVGAVKAYGVESEASCDLSEDLHVRAAVDWTHARVDGGAVAPRDTGRIPTETPAVAATAELTWRPLRRLSLSADVRYEGTRFDDDLNTLRLAPAASLDLRAEWRASGHAKVFIAAANVLDASLATGETAGGVYSYGPPRTVSAGVVLSGDGL